MKYFAFLLSCLVTMSALYTDEYVAKKNEYAAKLFSKLVKFDDNSCVSSYSVANALLLAYVGASGNTQKEIGALFLPKDIDENQAMKEAIAFAQYLEPVLHSAALVAIDPKAFVTTEYLERIQALGARAHTVNLKESLQEINNWIWEKTDGRIGDLVKEQDIATTTRLLLINALSVHASWQKPFNEYETNQALFYTKETEAVEVAMMHVKEHMPVFEDDNVLVCFKPLQFLSKDAPHLQAVIVLTKEKNRVPKASEIAFWQKGAKKRYVELFLPKHTVQSRFDLTQTLKILGLTESTSARATFSIIDPANTLCIEKVLHQTFMHIDEAGVEAAAATSVSIGLTSILEEEPIVVRCDKPFFIYLQDRASETILFSSYVAKPVL